MWCVVAWTFPNCSAPCHPSLTLTKVPSCMLGWLHFLCDYQFSMLLPTGSYSSFLCWLQQKPCSELIIHTGQSGGWYLSPIDCASWINSFEFSAGVTYEFFPHSPLLYCPKARCMHLTGPDWFPQTLSPTNQLDAPWAGPRGQFRDNSCQLRSA